MTTNKRFLRNTLLGTLSKDQKQNETKQTLAKGPSKGHSSRIHFQHGPYTRKRRHHTAKADLNQTNATSSSNSRILSNESVSEMYTKDEKYPIKTGQSSNRSGNTRTSTSKITDTKQNVTSAETGS